MTKDEQHQTAMLVHVRDYGVERAELFPASTVGGQMFAAVGESVAALDSHAATQVTGRGNASEGGVTKAVARTALRTQLEAISHTARALAVDTPGLENKFRLRSGGSDQGLLATAHAFAEAASAMAPAFVAHEMPANFLVSLSEAIGKLEAASHDRASGKAAHVAARAGIKAALQSGLAAVRKLDAIVPNKLKGDSAALAAWANIRHVERPSRSKRDTAAPAANPPVGTPAPTNGSAA